MYLINIDEQKRSEMEMLHRAETDAMTGLLNKEVIQKRIDDMLKKGTAHNGALFMVDLDYFKQINDTYGHNEGDHVIRATAFILKSTFQQNDIVGRLGGDEFGVFCVGEASKELLEERAGKICERIREIRPASSDHKTVTCSIGIAVHTDEQSFEELYKKADKALYVRKKEQGRNGYTFYQA